MTDCFDIETDGEKAQKCREWLDSPLGKPFWEYIQREADRRHGSAILPPSDNPIKDIILSQRELSAEEALLAILAKAQDEISLGKNS